METNVFGVAVRKFRYLTQVQAAKDNENLTRNYGITVNRCQAKLLIKSLFINELQAI